jgi:aspartate/methionine/tyrosine aminotransferase
MRQTIQNLEESKIREVANAGLGRHDVLAFWFGESDEVTPDFIRATAIDSLQRGETFYAHNLGLPELRHAIAGAMTAQHASHPGERQPRHSTPTAQAFGKVEKPSHDATARANLCDLRRPV